MNTGPSLRSIIAEHWHLARQLRYLNIHFDPDRCSGVWECYEVCPVDCWTPDQVNHKVIYHHPDLCIACGACVLQCPEGAIELK